MRGCAKSRAAAGHRARTGWVRATRLRLPASRWEAFSLHTLCPRPGVGIGPTVMQSQKVTQSGKQGGEQGKHPNGFAQPRTRHRTATPGDKPTTGPRRVEIESLIRVLPPTPLLVPQPVGMRTPPCGNRWDRWTAASGSVPEEGARASAVPAHAAPPHRVVRGSPVPENNRRGRRSTVPSHDREFGGKTVDEKNPHKGQSDAPV